MFQRQSDGDEQGRVEEIGGKAVARHPLRKPSLEIEPLAKENGKAKAHAQAEERFPKAKGSALPMKAAEQILRVSLQRARSRNENKPAGDTGAERECQPEQAKAARNPREPVSRVTRTRPPRTTTHIAEK